MSTRPTIRSAIYTRKSTDEGLDQEFNSLDAQHEACAAYIASQRHEGWKQVKERYDDGGISGATLERPALQRLLADIDAGRVEMVVVYKIDRLTRSLADFARLVERLDAAGCSFVSVTQAFNTSTSMGRLTLNVLLSFAQFEREVTAERIRDKIAASKKKGLWMGGPAPLGYDAHPDPQTRELVVNPEGAQVVQKIFDLYAAHGCLRRVTDEATQLGLTSKRHVFATGRVQGGKLFSRGQIYYILRNPVYLGKIRHKDNIWPGQHSAIIDQALWDRVQGALEDASSRQRGQASQTNRAGDPAAPSVLAGKFRDETGDRLTPTHTRRHGRRLRYYVSNRLISGGTDASGWRLPGPAFEAAVARVVAGRIEEAATGYTLQRTADARSGRNLVDAAVTLSAQLRTRTPDLLGALVLSGNIETGRIIIRLDPDILAAELGLSTEALDPRILTVAAPFEQRRRGVESRILTGDFVPQPDPTLPRLLACAHRWTDELRGGRKLTDIARSEGHSESYIRTRAQLAFLSPKIQAALVEGRQPTELTAKQMLRRTLPLDWVEQERIFGFTC